MRKANRTSDRTGSGKILRCAIYTRKSTDEGLDQAFNSLDAQREACAAYVQSQQHEGWVLLPATYDDGGFSGGNVDRPGLQQLLAEVKAGRIDCIIVYKVDRLTRSLADFAKIVEILDAAGASFVSITQAFNTTTSMGRLTLNVLLSFAQFEREVISERVRDKIAASKAKGMWMGGPVPLGYRVENRRLIIDEAEARTVRSILAQYLRIRSVPRLIHALTDEGIATKVQNMRDGSVRGGIPFTRGSAYHLLKNRIYRGEIVHKDKVYPGEHQAIIERELFDAVQQALAESAGDQHRRPRASEPSLLTGMIRDAKGRAMSPRHPVKDGRRYRYYVSQTIAPGTAGIPTDASITRLPAGELEDAVRQSLITYLQDEPSLVAQAHANGIDDARRLLDWGAAAAREATAVPTTQLRDTLLSIGWALAVDRKGVIATLDLGSLFSLAMGTAGERTICKSAPITINVDRKNYGHEMRLCVAPPNQSDKKRHPKLFELIIRAFAARDYLLSADGDVAAANASTPHLLRIARLAYARVAELGFQPQMETIDQAPLNIMKLRAIALPLSKIIDWPTFAAAMQDIAGSHLRSIKQPAPSKDEARYQLKMIAHLTWKMNLPRANRDKLSEEVRKRVRTLNFLANAFMWRGIREITGQSRNLQTILYDCEDLEMIGNAAVFAVGVMPKAGDYGDLSVDIAVQLLVEAYETVTGRRATLSRNFYRTRADGKESRIATSECGRFVIAFFSQVDPEIGDLTLSNVLENFSIARRGGQKQPFP